MKKIKGKVFKFQDDVNTDEIIPAKYLVTVDQKELGRHCMVGIRQDFPLKVSEGDLIVAGENFGCGSSREHAPLSIKGCGVSCVIAVSFARIFYRNCINIGLPILECSQAKEIKQDDILDIDLEKGNINNLTSEKTYKVSSFPPFIEEIISSGGLINWIKKSS